MDVRGRLPREEREQGAELDLGLGQFGGRVRVRDDTGTRKEVGAPVAEQRRAQRHAELAVLGGVHPADGAGIPAAIESLELGDHRLGLGGGRLGPYGGSGMQEACQLEHRTGLGQLSADRRGEVLDVRDLDHDGLGSHFDPDRERIQPALDPPRHDRVLLTVLGALHELLAEVGIHGRIGATTRRAGQRDRRGPGSVAPDEELGRSADKRGLGRADAEHKAGLEDLTEGAKESACGVGRGGIDGHLTGQHELVDAAGADSLHSGGHGPFVVSGRPGAPYYGARRGRGVQGRQ